MAASPTLHLPEDTLDDILYFARTNSLSDLKELLAENAAIQRTTPLAILTAAVDPYSGNDALHMASANGHTGMYKSCLFISNILCRFLFISCPITLRPSLYSTSSS